ncbi:989_t:CDS:2, partial [Dentiscutata erythropus]
TTRSSVRKNPIQIVKDPIIKKKVAKNSSKPKQINSNTMEEIHETEESQDMIYENQPEVIILSKDKGKNKEITTEQNVPFDKQSLENNPLGGNVDESEWTQVTNKKNKQKNIVNTQNPTLNDEDKESIASYETENSHHPDWRQEQETELILVRSENNGKDKMISVLFDNKEKMQKAKKINVSENVELPAYMHAAQVYKSRPFNDNNKGVKLLIPTGMWQFAIAIFENEESEKNLLQQWSIIIGEDSFCVTPADCNYNQLMERGKYAAQIINLPFGITAREIIPNIMTIKALTCYIPRTRNYRRKGEAIISFVDETALNGALGKEWTKGEYNIKVVNIKTITCHQCHSEEHIAKDCPRTIRDRTFEKKNEERFVKFGGIYKRHNPKLFSSLNKQFGKKTFADALRSDNNQNQIVTNKKESNNIDERLERIENIINNLVNRMTNLEALDNNDPSIETTNVEPDKTDKLLNVVENIGQRISSLEDSLHSSKNNNRSHRIETTQNLRGINSELKQQNWWNFCIENNLDIIAIIETKLIKRHEWTIFNNQKKKSSNTIIDNTKTYHTWWASKETRGSGSGVGIMVCSDIAQHVYKIDRFEARAICLYLSFNGKCTVQLIATYAPTQQPKYRNEIKELNKWLTNKLGEALSKDMISIVLGDWNAVPNPKKDRFSDKKSILPESIILKSIIEMGYEDCHQLTLTKEKEYTYHEWNNGSLRSASRIDQIWIHPQYFDKVREYQIEDTELFADSDHHMVTISIEADQWWDNCQYRRNKRVKKQKKFLWNVKKSTVEQWDKFASALDEELSTNTGILNENTSLEYKWNIFKNAIISAGNQNLLKSKEPKNRTKVCKNIHKDFGKLNMLSKIHRIGKMLSQGKTISSEMKKKFDDNCSILNSKNKDFIPLFPVHNPATQINWVKNIRDIWYTLKKVIKIDMDRLRNTSIEKYIKRWQSFFETSPIKMISSALEREQKRIEVKLHLFNWTSNPRNNPINLTSQWEKQYTPKVGISKLIYNPVTSPILIQEVEETIMNFSNDKAPGPSKIPYEIFKHMNNVGITAMVNIFNEILTTGKVPRDWTNSSVVLIPKPKEWEGNLEITRPITLMETMRKIFTKIINDRLVK